MDKEFVRGAVGRLKFSDWNSVVRRLRLLQERIEKLEREAKGFSAKQEFPAEITGHIELTSVPEGIGPPFPVQFLYSWRKVARNPNDQTWITAKRPKWSFGGGPSDPSSVAPTVTYEEINSTIEGDPFALGAVNGIENGNQPGDGDPTTTAGIMGPGVNTDNTSYITCSLELKPISNGCVVPMRAVHGILSPQQVTGNRSSICYYFSVSNAHDKASTNFTGRRR